jgi:hypothetical protein
VAGAPINEPQDILPELLIPNANPDFSHHPGADDDDGSTIAAQSPLSISSESFN